MNRGVGFVFVVILLFGVLSMSLVSSVEISLKENFKKGEGFVAKISGNFVKTLTKENIIFYRTHLQTEMGKYNLVKIEGDYYIYFEIPLEKEAGNYSLELNEIEYKLGRETIKGSVYKNFTIMDENASFSVSPQLIITKENYSVILENLLSKSIKINLEQEIKTVEEMEENQETVESGGFLDSLFGLFSSDEITETTNETQTEEVIVEDVKSITLASGDSIKLNYVVQEKRGFEKLEFYYEDEVYSVLVYNPEDRIKIEENETIKEDETEENVTFTDSKGVIFNLTSPTPNQVLYRNTQIPINFTISNPDKIDSCWYSLNNGEKNNTLEDCKNSTFSSTENKFNFTIYFNDSSNNISSIHIKNIEIKSISGCEEINATVCKAEVEKCEGDIKYTDNEICCVGKCVEIEKNSNKKIIGWSIIILVVLFLAWFLKKKYMKSGPGNINLFKIAKGE